jgi:hypothetical protein
MSKQRDWLRMRQDVDKFIGKAFQNFENTRAAGRSFFFLGNFARSGRKLELRDFSSGKGSSGLTRLVLH